MNRETGIPLRDYILARFVSSSFRRLLDCREPAEKCDKVKPINVTEHGAMGPMFRFWIAEINSFNNLSLNHDNQQRFDKVRAFLLESVRLVSVKLVRSELIENPAALFAAFLCEQALKHGSSADNMDIEFSFNENTTDVPNEFIVEGLWMTNGSVVNGNLQSSPHLFNKLPLMHCRCIQKTVRTAKLYNCPMYVNIAYPELVCDLREEVDVDHTENFVGYVPIQSGRLDRGLVLDGTAIYWRLPVQFCK
jgi:hypothetical protein